MSSREIAMKQAKCLVCKTGSLAAFIRELTLEGYFDTAASSGELLSAVKNRFGRKFPVTYVQTYMKPFLQAGILRAKRSEKYVGNLWLGSWLKSDSRSKNVKSLDLEIETTAWDVESSQDFDIAILCYTNELWKPAAVMVRRSYEGALALRYRSIEGNDPTRQAVCPKCSTKLGTRPLSITDLHNWASKNGLVREKLDGLGVLLKDLGAGGAHLGKSNVIDSNTAEIILKCGAVLLGDLYLQRPTAVAPATNGTQQSRVKGPPVCQ